MDRRLFLKSSAALLGTGLFPFGQSGWALAANPASPTQKKLVVVMLRGAVDGLNVVAPYADANYYALRPGIAVAKPGAADGLLDLDGYFGLHPALTPLQPLWQAKQLAFVHAAGSPDATRSHFDAQDYMESGTPGRKGTADGWMNRLLATLPGEMSPTRAVSIGPTLPRILSGRIGVANVASGNAAGKPTVLDRPKVDDAFSQLYKGDDKLAQAYEEARETHKEVMDSLADEMMAASNGAPLPNGFPTDAVQLAKLMRKGNVQLAFIALGGWDTHINQGAGKGQLANRLAPVGEGLAQLAQALGPMWNDTTVVVMSEFGRTAKQNGNGGTDHGHGNVMWLLGGAVAGGKVYGDWRGLDNAALYEQRDVPVTTDFRAVLAQVAERHLRLPDAQLAQIFPGLTTTAPRGLIRA
ncbi:Uncharacterized conserved protein, DUF1501 family [Andreprevotia lacus DSM 23236]|uniref:Uncharacterized conserved protein, DUF1501 family n=1 Tax=Andreprevotia lacus DSM 23236 TaxID=1121001 RepID=A0A1W1XKL7_9NEIS|nr:DUF1501 domain-containing protein [Andreprevotia lacus]SMC24382.1 Uncharacterized conserved protein, DUF1501 family [Andreprevotia lacus DSM 23236]